MLPPVKIPPLLLVFPIIIANRKKAGKQIILFLMIFSVARAPNAIGFDKSTLITRMNQGRKIVLRICLPQWYGGEHKAPALQAEAVYGLTELARDEVRGARLVANPGCYPTAAQLPLIALLRAGVILPDDIIIDAKSGTTGAGRAPKQGTLYCEVSAFSSVSGSIARQRPISRLKLNYDWSRYISSLLWPRASFPVLLKRSTRLLNRLNRLTRLALEHLHSHRRRETRP